MNSGTKKRGCLTILRQPLLRYPLTGNIKPYRTTISLVVAVLSFVLSLQ